MPRVPTRLCSQILAFAGVFGLAGCNNYELFRVAGYEQVSFSNDAEIIFIIDNSASMQEEATDLALNFTTFIDTLTDTQNGGGLETNSLSDAVRNYIRYTSERGRYIDYQLGITTTSVEVPESNPNLPGVYGELVGDPTLIQDTDVSIAGPFIQNLLCESTCWNDSFLPADPTYECRRVPDDPSTIDAQPAQISIDYLNCLCGFEEWTGHCGSGNEEQLESAVMAMCRAVEDPPEECYDGTPFTDSAILTNEGMLRPNSTVIFVIITDEGDTSRRLANGEDDPQDYIDLLDLFGVRYRFAVVGPNYDYEAGTLNCNSGGATIWGSRRLQLAAEYTNGFYNSIAEEGAGGDCPNSDFSQHLDDLGQLLLGLQQSFPLQSYPDIDTIVAYVNGENVPQGYLDPEASEAQGTEVYTDGWTYEASTNSVYFHGNTVPDYNAEVDIYYKPLEGTPRTLPF